MDNCLAMVDDGERSGRGVSRARPRARRRGNAGFLPPAKKKKRTCKETVKRHVEHCRAVPGMEGKR